MPTVHARGRIMFTPPHPDRPPQLIAHSTEDLQWAFINGYISLESLEQHTPAAINTTMVLVDLDGPGPSGPIDPPPTTPHR